MLNLEIDRLKGRLESMIAHKLEVDVHLLDEGMSIVDFYSFTATWLIQLAGIDELKNTHSTPSSLLSMSSLMTSTSLSSESEPAVQNFDTMIKKVPRLFSVVPEWIVENMADYFTFVCRFNPKILLFSTNMNPIITLFVLLLGSGRHLRNPYLRSKFAEVLFLFSCADEDSTNSQLTTVGKGLWHFFESNSIARNYMLPSLISLYVDIETTGRHMQFYEKFSVRRNIAILIKHLRGIPYYNNRMKEEPIRNFQIFFKFVHRLLDDSIYLLDELILKAKEAIDIETQMESQQFGTLPQEERQELSHRHHQIIGTVEFYARHANEMIQLLHSITQTNFEIFLRPENVDRIAGMLNYFLKKLVGQSRLVFLPRFVKKISFQPFVLFRQVCLSFSLLFDPCYLNQLICFII
jgi:ubiquitin conjugation factor E4 B